MFKANRFLAIIAVFLFVVNMGSCGGGEEEKLPTHLMTPQLKEGLSQAL